MKTKGAVMKVRNRDVKAFARDKKVFCVHDVMDKFNTRMDDAFWHIETLERGDVVLKKFVKDKCGHSQRKHNVYVYYEPKTASKRTFWRRIFAFSG